MVATLQYELPNAIGKDVKQLAKMSREAVAMYNSSMKRSVSKIHVFKEFMRGLELSWPEPPSWRSSMKVLFNLAFNWNMELLFGVRLLPDTTNRPQRSIYNSPSYTFKQWCLLVNKISNFDLYHRYWSSLYLCFTDHPNVKMAGCVRRMLQHSEQAYAAVADPARILNVVYGTSRVRQERLRFCATEVERTYDLLVAAMATLTHFSGDERQETDNHLATIRQISVTKTAHAHARNQACGDAAARDGWHRAVARGKVPVAERPSPRLLGLPRQRLLVHRALDQDPRQRAQRADLAAMYEMQRLASSFVEPYIQYRHLLNDVSLSL
ncbi:hypothetical protein HPB48_005363 [Haemaphysalis longicornis]|uniref:Uncharacterized protein n=1 Tax=Haemaphysalis longicornis TaxID=44386 RepID=A0A9J6G6R3_HAELO|nr:hypothetical protein HPB48_005363 [Haemaphysalis longicornis]